MFFSFNANLWDKVRDNLYMCIYRHNLLLADNQVVITFGSEDAKLFGQRIGRRIFKMGIEN